MTLPDNVKKAREEMLKAQMREYAAKTQHVVQMIQLRCRHRTYHGSWSIGLVHNFFDQMPRGLCLQCHTLIEPNHWADGGPNKIVWKPAHVLYPVVQILDRTEAKLVMLEQKHIQTVDCLLSRPKELLEETRRYQKERDEILLQCERDTKPWRDGI